MQPLDFGFPREGNTIAMVPSELMVHEARCTLFFATHDGKFAGWKEWMSTSADSCKTWSTPAPAPGRLHERTFIRNHIVTRDGRILLPFQHYLGARPRACLVIPATACSSVATEERHGPNTATFASRTATAITAGRRTTSWNSAMDGSP